MNTKIKLFTFAVALVTLFTSCSKDRVRPSGDIVSEDRNVSDFHQLDVSDAFSVWVNYSDSEEGLRIEADDNLLSYIKTYVDNGRLVIMLDRDLNIRGNSVLRAYVTVKSLNSIHGSGAAEFSLNNTVIAEGLDIRLAGASTLFGPVQTVNMTTRISGASELYLTGHTDDMSIEASGASEFGSYGLDVDHLSANLSGASGVELTVNKTIRIKASGASHLYYKGDAVTTSIDLSGASEVEKK